MPLAIGTMLPVIVRSVRMVMRGLIAIRFGQNPA